MIKKNVINVFFPNQWHIEQMAMAREVNLKYCIIISIVVVSVLFTE